MIRSKTLKTLLVNTENIKLRIRKCERGYSLSSPLMCVF